MSPTLTDRQSQVLAFVQRYIQRHNRPPTMKEIGAEVGISSTSAVSKSLDALQAKGYVIRTPNVSRGLRIVGSQPGSLASSTVSLPYVADAFDRHPESLRKVSDGTLHVDASMLAGQSASDVIVVAASDDGMTGEGIRKGDRIVTHLAAAKDMTSETLAVVVLREQLVVRFIHFARRLWHVKPVARHYAEETFENGDSAFFPIGHVLGVLRFVAKTETSPAKVRRR